MTPLGVMRYGGIWPDSRGTGFQRMRHLELYALIVLLRGGGLFRDVSGTETTLMQGDVFCVVPGVDHQYGPEDGRLWSEAFITFAGPPFDGWCQAGVLQSGNVSRNHRSPAAVEAEFRSILTHPMRNRHDAVFLLNRVHLMISDLFGEDQTRPTTTQSRLDRSRHHLETWPIAVPVNWNEISSTAGYSYHAWRRVFRERFGISPGHYRREVVAQHGATLLLKTDMTLEEIAQRLHLTDASHLSRMFRIVYGESPGTFRRRRSRHAPGGSQPTSLQTRDG